MSKFNMTVEAVDTAAERRRRLVKVIGLSGFAVTAVAAGAYLAWYLTPPAMPDTIEDAIAVANSPRYKRLSDEQKQPYLDVIREQFGSLDREQRRAMLGDDEDARDMARDAMRAMMMERMKAFGAASFEERQAMADQMPRRPRGGEGGRGGEGARGEGARGDGGGRGGGNADRMRNGMSRRMAEGNAQNMATMGLIIQQRRQDNGGQGGRR